MESRSAMAAFEPALYVFAAFGFVVFAGAAGLMIAAAISNYAERRKRRKGH
jgi:hypothetical protein